MRAIDADKVKAIAREECKDCIMNGSVYCKRECFTNRVCDYIDNAPKVERPQASNNSELFKQTFGMYATELWTMSEADFLKWLNQEIPEFEKEGDAE